MKRSTNYYIKSSVSAFIGGVTIPLAANPEGILQVVGILLGVVLLLQSFRFYNTAEDAKKSEEKQKG